MVGHRRRHRGRRSHKALARGGLIATLVGVAAALMIVLPGSPGSGSSDSLIASRMLSSAPPLDIRSGSAASPVRADRGVVRGILRLRTDVPADSRIWVAYVIDGPTSMIRFARKAPYRVDIDTRLLPDGVYTVDEVIFRPSAEPSVKTGRIRVDNRGSAVPPRPLTATASSSAPPAGPPQSQLASPASPAVGDPSSSLFPPSSSAAAPGLSVPVQATTLPPATATGARPAPAAPVPGAGPAPGSAGNLAAQVVELTNAERAKAGCPPLAVDARLTAAAQAHSTDMAAGNYFSHDSRDGRTPFQRVATAGYTFSVAAENIAAGQRNPQDVTAGWMGSPGHRANIVNCSLTHIGVGYATGGTYGTYWTQDFGTP